jgi:glycosyltransferase involved in cell wall biosynthesis
MAPRYSIVVPTCERAGLLRHTLRALLAIDRDDIEIVVSDNASSDDTQAVIAELKSDKRLVAVRTDRRLSMPDHWDFAFNHSSGEWIIINGDDDGLSPSIFNYLDSAISTLKPKLLSWHCGLYHHPDYNSEGTPDTLHLLAGHSRLATVIDPARMIELYARFQFDFFPEATRFCVARSLAETVIKKTGRLFWPTCPDFTSSLLCLCEISRGDYVYLDAALSFGGRSAQSNAAALSPRSDKTRIKSFFTEFQDADVYPFHEPKLPFYYNGHAAALTLAKQFYPLAGVEIDTYFLYRTMFEELSGVRYNPLITQSVMDDLKKHIEGMASSKREAVDKARGEVEEAVKARAAEKKRRLNLSTTLVLSKHLIKRAIFGRDYNSRWQRVIPYKIALSGFDDSFGLSSRWDRILDDKDPFTTEPIDRAIAAGLLISAHNLSGIKLV